MRNHAVIVLYLVSVVLANLSVAFFGAGISIVNAFLFIGLDLTTRDMLHEQWEHKNLWRNMALLIGAGSVLSALLNWDVLPIALASFVAFASAGVADTITYNVLRNHSRIVRVNGSNMVSAAVDSVVFPALAFGFPLLVPIMLGQFAAKTFGGYVWSLILFRGIREHD